MRKIISKLLLLVILSEVLLCNADDLTYIQNKNTLICESNDIINDKIQNHTIILSMAQQGTLQKNKDFLKFLAVIDMIRNVINSLKPFFYLYTYLSCEKLHIKKNEDTMLGMLCDINRFSIPKNIFSYFFFYFTDNHYKVFKSSSIKLFFIKDLLCNWLIDANVSEIVEDRISYYWIKDYKKNKASNFDNSLFCCQPDSQKTIYFYIDAISYVRNMVNVISFAVRTILNTIFICNISINNKNNLFFNENNNTMNCAWHPDYTVGYGNRLAKVNFMNTISGNIDKFIITGKTEILSKTPRILFDFINTGTIITVIGLRIANAKINTTNPEETLPEIHKK